MKLRKYSCICERFIYSRNRSAYFAYFENEAAQFHFWENENRIMFAVHPKPDNKGGTTICPASLLVLILCGRYVSEQKVV